MTFSRKTGVGSLLAAGLIAAGMMSAAPAGADTATDDFLGALRDAGLADLDPAQALQIGQSLCPLIAERSQNTADIANEVSESLGRPLGPATMFTGAAVSFLCPRAVDNLANDGPLIPLFG